LVAAALRIVIVGAICTLLPFLADGSGHSDPAAVAIVTSDIDNFWHAFTDAERARDPSLTYGIEYFARGTVGLWGFIPSRLQSPDHLRNIVAKNRPYYLAARPAMLRIASERPAILADLRRYKKAYPKAVFPNVYFVVGALNSGGTSVPAVGLVLGAEMFSVPPNIDAIPMGRFNKQILHGIDRIPPVVVHELTHFNQHDADPKALLDSALIEGSADFVSQLVDGNNVDSSQWTFGCAHEAELWTAFSAQMQSADEKVVTAWLYSYDPGPIGAPPFIGYWLGSRIVQTYYDRRPDKEVALDAILHLTDYRAFLRASGYPAKRPPCSPQRRVAG
jgi:hypothetical protein